MKKKTLTILLALCILLLDISIVFAQTSAYSLFLPMAAKNAQSTAAVTATSTATATTAPTATPTTGPVTEGGAYYQSGGTVTKSNISYSSATDDESAVKVTNSGTFTLSSSQITKTGNTSSNDNSSFYGLNAALLAEDGSTITLTDSTISATGSGANGAFSTGSGSTVNLANVTITAIGGGAHGVMATQGGVMTMTDVDIVTTGANSAPIATDRGSGTITVLRGESTTSGADSPCLYSTGVISVTDASCTATGAEAAVIEGANSIVLNNTSLTTSVASKWGVMIYQSMSGDAEGKQGVFTMTGGTLAHTASSGPLFYVTNTTGIITLNAASVTAGSGTLLQASGNSRWGTSGSNGGTVVLTANGQSLTGSLTVDAISSVSATLNSASSLTGAINTAGTAGTFNLALDSTSSWSVTANSYLTCLSDTAGISGTTISNITGNGYTVYYDSASCSALGGKTYTLAGSGTLKPK